MEIWYTVTGNIEKKTTQDAIQWINEQLYAKPITRLRLLVASAGGDIDSGVNLHTYLKALPLQQQEQVGFSFKRRESSDRATATPVFRQKRDKPSESSGARPG